MTIIEQLQHHENNQLEEWLDFDDKTSKRFSKDIVKFANSNPEEFKNYCINTIPSEYSSLSIIYEALSEYTTAWNAFLFEEVKRVVNLAKLKQIKYEYIEVLEEIETEDIYSKDEDIYIEVLNFLTSQLHLSNDEGLNLGLLSLISWFIIEYDEDDAISEIDAWVNSIKNLADNATQSNVKLEAREILDDLDDTISFKPLSILENIKRLFK